MTDSESANGQLEPVRSGAIRLLVDPAWETQRDVDPSIRIVSVDPREGSMGLRPSHVVTVDDFADSETEVDLRTWQISTDLALAEQLDGFILIDLEHVEISGHPGVRRLASYTGAHGASATMVQWCVLVGARGYTLTSTVPTLSFPFVAEDLDATAASWQIETTEEAP